MGMLLKKQIKVVKQIETRKIVQVAWNSFLESICCEGLEHVDRLWRRTDKRVMRIMFNRASSNAWYVLVDTMQGETWL